jgi:hypothetical protein
MKPRTVYLSVEGNSNFSSDPLTGPMMTEINAGGSICVSNQGKLL